MEYLFTDITPMSILTKSDNTSYTSIYVLKLSVKNHSYSIETCAQKQHKTININVQRTKCLKITLDRLT